MCRCDPIYFGILWWRDGLSWDSLRPGLLFFLYVLFGTRDMLFNFHMQGQTVLYAVAAGFIRGYPVCWVVVLFRFSWLEGNLVFSPIFGSCCYGGGLGCLVGSRRGKADFQLCRQLEDDDSSTCGLCGFKDVRQRRVRWNTGR